MPILRAVKESIARAMASFGIWSAPPALTGKSGKSARDRVNSPEACHRCLTQLLEKREANKEK